MSLQADNQIRALCTTPNHITVDGVLEYHSEAFKKAQLNEYGFYSRTTPSPDQLSNCQPMISPFINESVRFINTEGTPVKEDYEGEKSKVISYGLSSFGYDARIADEFKLFTNLNSTIVDPKQFDKRSFVDHKGPYCIIPPNSFVLARTVERFKMPKDMAGICLTKSTYARVGIYCLATPLEPGWEGYLTLEYANTTPLPAKLYANEGGLQIMFFKGSVPCDVTYADRAGKYNHQLEEITLPKA